MRADELLKDARHLLEQSHRVDAWSRSAALLARHALEACVKEAIEARHGTLMRPTFSSQLVVLRTVVSEETAREVAWTWSALSSATHAHSYELPATADELRRWIDVVENLSRELSG